MEAEGSTTPALHERVRARLAPLEQHPYSWLAVWMTAATLLVWAPYWADPSPLYRFWDGPHYMYVAKTLYRVPADHPLIAYDVPPAYFASHFPAYPVLIRVLTLVTFGHYPAAMLLATLLSSIAAALLYYRMLVVWKLVASPLWTASLFCVFPPRWLLYHSVGATEPLFFCAVFGAFIALRRNRVLYAVLWTGLAAVTRITGVLLGPVFFWIYGRRRQWRAVALLPLAGLGVLALFALYAQRFGDFFAALRWNAGQLGIVQWPPFKILDHYASLGDARSAELIFWTYIVYGLGTLFLFRHRELFVYCSVFLVFGTLLFHNDLSRMFLPLAPFAILVGFDSILTRRAFRLLLPLIIGLSSVYAWELIPNNAISPAAFEQLLEQLK